MRGVCPHALGERVDVPGKRLASTASRWLAWAALGVSFGVGTTVAIAQEAPVAQDISSGRPGGVLTLPAQVPTELGQHSVTPDAVYMLDERGNRVLVPDFTFERWSQLERAASGNRATTVGDLPALADQAIAIRGTVTGQWADLEVVLNGQLPAIEQGAALALRMDNFFQDGSSQITGSTGARSELGSDGYRVRFPAGPPGNIEFRGRFAARVGQLNGSPLLEFRLPVARTTIELTIPQTGVQGAIIGRGTEQLETESLGEAGTLLRIRGSGGDLKLQWQQGSWTIDRAALLDVRSTWSVEWAEPDRPPRATVQLTVQNQVGRLRSLEVTLPPQASLSPATIATQAWRMERTGESTEAVGERWRFDRLTESDERSADLQLGLEWTRSDFTDTQPLRLGGLTVEGAIRQPGTINIKVPADYQLRWRQASGLRSVERSDAQTLRFAYDQPPFELAAWLVADQRRLQITPRYTISAAPVASTLQCELTGLASGPATGTLELQMHGWQLLNVTIRPDDQPFEGFEVRDGVLRLDLAALTGSEAGESRFQLLIAAMQPRDSASDRLKFTLPTLMQDASDRQAFVAIDDTILEFVPVEGWQVIPDASSLLQAGLVSESSGDNPLRYRMPAGRPAPFDGLLERVEPRASANVDFEARLESEQIQLSQRWSVRVEQGVLAGPQLIIQGDPSGIIRWSVEVDGRSEFLERRDEGQRVVLSLPGVRLSRGDHTVILRWARDYAMDLSPSPQGTQPWQELLLPYAQLWYGAAVPLGQITGEILSPENWETRWKQAERGPLADAGQGPRPAASGLAVEVKLREESLPSDLLLVERAWLQTVLGRTLQRERMVLNLRGSGTYVLRNLDWPRDTTIRIAIDRRVVREGTHSGESLSIDLGGSDPEALHLVEVWAWIPRSDSNSPRGNLIRPQTSSLTGARQIYWQLVTPREEHLLWSPAGLARAMQWQWQYGLRRVPVMDDAALCRWVGCEPEIPLPPGNRYLFAASTSSDLEAHTVSRMWLWLGAAIPAFLAMALLNAWPRLRRPLALAAVALVLCGLASIAPDAAVLFAQLLLLIVIPVAGALALRRGWNYWQSTRMVRAMKQIVPVEPTGSSRQRTTEALRPAEVLSQVEGSSRRFSDPTVPLVRGDLP